MKRLTDKKWQLVTWVNVWQSQRLNYLQSDWEKESLDFLSIIDVKKEHQGIIDIKLLDFFFDHFIYSPWKRKEEILSSGSNLKFTNSPIWSGHPVV